ncbi:T-cell surface antigen CD2-like isoform X2 [Channa argus]|uniref:T-cell surface antigen CD2-like isoform X2 n=1 Tax=Channa argus TaxID=215402 RepID=UPI0035205EB0
MEAVVGLLVALLGVSHGVETYCDGRQNRTQCYGALGGAVVLHLMDNAAGKKIQWKKNNTNIMYWNNNTFVYNEIQDRSLFTPNNGKIRITHLSRIDGGEYKLQLFDSNGQISALRILQLSIQAPVSSVLLVSECLSQGEIRVSCSSEGGDSPHYSWTLDGHTLTDAELLSGNNETNSITLKQQVSGNLVCSVRNQVSSVSKEQKTPDCGNMPVLAGVLTALVLLLVIGLAVICTQTKKKNNKPKDEDNEQEVTYADVRIMQQQGRQLQQTAEVEVEYGQVRFSGRPQQTVKP